MSLKEHLNYLITLHFGLEICFSYTQTFFISSYTVCKIVYIEFAVLLIQL